MTILSRIRVVEIARIVSRIFQLQPFCQLVFHPSRTGMTKTVDHRALSLREVFQAPKLTPLSLSEVRTIWASVLKEKRDVLGVVRLVTG